MRERNFLFGNRLEHSMFEIVRRIDSNLCATLDQRIQQTGDLCSSFRTRSVVVFTALHKLPFIVPMSKKQQSSIIDGTDCTEKLLQFAIVNNVKGNECPFVKLKAGLALWFLTGCLTLANVQRCRWENQLLL